MSSRTTLLVWLFVVTGCAVGERPVLTDESIEGVPGGAEASPVEEPETIDPSASLAARGGGPVAVISPNGILVPVLDIRDGNYLVLSPCGVETELAWGQAIRDVTVVLDPGHGGPEEEGAVGPSGETEAEVNLDIARRTATLLEAQDISVALTRTADYRVPVANRAAIADLLEAEAFVSIHHNSPTPSQGSDTPGTEVYVQNDSADSSRLGGLLYEETVAALGVFDVEWSSRSDAGVLVVLSSDGEDAFGINRRPTTPTALVEMAYLSNPSEALVLGTSEYRQAAAVGLTNAIIRYLESDDPGSGFIDEPRLFDPSAETGGTDGCADPDLG